MRQMSVLDRLLLFVTGLLAAYQVLVGVEGLGTLAVTSYTIAFGVLLVACLWLIILGFEVLDSPVVVVSQNVGPEFSTNALGMGVRFTRSMCPLRARLEEPCSVQAPPEARKESG